MLVGEPGAVRCIGKFYISPRDKYIEEMQLILFAGSLVSPEGGNLVKPENTKYAEMWECEIIIIPRRKYSSLEKNKPISKQKIPFNGWRIDQILASTYGDSDAWGDKYFDYKETKEVK